MSVGAIRFVLYEVDGHRQRGADADLGVNLQIVRILFDVRQAHAGAVAHLADLGGGGGPPLLHGQVDIGDSGPLVGHHHHNLAVVDIDVDGAAIGVCHGVDLRLKEGDDRPLDVGRIHTELLERALDAARSLSRIGKVPLFYSKGIVHNRINRAA